MKTLKEPLPAEHHAGAHDTAAAMVDTTTEVIVQLDDALQRQQSLLARLGELLAVLEHAAHPERPDEHDRFGEPTVEIGSSRRWTPSR